MNAGDYCRRPQKTGRSRGRKPGYLALLSYTKQHSFLHRFGRGECIEQFSISSRIERNKNMQAIYAACKPKARKIPSASIKSKNAFD